ncbi:DUF423 domain-containing protein [Flammeovirga kamogawensis]|uniref:DUF423 domain-containing protein n=1 Tax=Flammeovirga kamogawensis TaxID=373891 RepID=A0ABX8GTW0_9BACT|nr:DUF423 domain-containing protein [Flammeovirga kamogawensis]MBB6462520.1 uncharacterized membrane protein YgdD (TMEM256/DUF423 family) [Flammeovirga kamogawensis]QWG06743.1 DUF423 domain-containing protein [Flammeovirga kamogawensis]TRX68566.1 DUF423 domain-containing protein [Flammeovirga kamogawensis]
MSRNIIIIGAIFCALAVGIGAFGAHGLKSVLLENGRLETFETGVKYHFYHGLGLLILGALAQQIDKGWLKWAAVFMVAGIFIFSGSLYILSITGITWLGAITPIGGVGFIAAWIALACGVKKESN